jgi:hypothetical protein
VGWEKSLEELDLDLDEELGSEDLESKLNFDRELERDAVVGADVLQNYAEADWWNWKGGSTLFFWRWPEGEQRRAARDGMNPWIQGPLPRFEKRAKKPSPEKHHKILLNFVKFLQRKYVRFKRRVKNLSDYFDVPKDDDIRMVFNVMGCGLNEATWAPNFRLLTARTATRVLDFDYKTVDINSGEMFLNFPPAEAFREYSGIDLEPFRDDLADLMRVGNCNVNPEDAEEEDEQQREELRQLWARWKRCWMGFKSSPFYAVRFYYWADEFVRGNWQANNKPLWWDEVKLNLAGDPSYDPTFPEVMK